MALRNIFSTGNLPEGLSSAAENKINSWTLNKFGAVLVTLLAAAVEGLRRRNDPRTATTGNVHAPSVNTAAVVTFAGATGVTHAITGFAWSYSGTTTTGNIKVKDGTNVILDIDVPVGFGVIEFPQPFKSTAGNLLSVTAAAGGASSTGKVSVLNHYTL